MYGYEYVGGDLLRGVWKSLSEDEKIDICRNLGKFHAEIGKKFTKEMAETIGIKIDMSADLHPEVSADYDRLIIDANVPENFKTLVKEAKSIFDRTQDKIVFQFLHNDSHHENIIIKDKAISGIIDFGNAEYGETAKEFSRYTRDFPDHFQYIVSSYEEESGNRLSRERLVNNALISGFIDIVEDYWKGGESREKAEKAIEKYKELLNMSH
jgi:Ser/Thr protein kinase RdoA (MazF antagonist)